MGRTTRPSPSRSGVNCGCRKDGIGAREHVVQPEPVRVHGRLSPRSCRAARACSSTRRQATFDARARRSTCRFDSCSPTPRTCASATTDDVRRRHLRHARGGCASSRCGRRACPTSSPDFTVDQDGVYYHRQDVVLDGPFWPVPRASTGARVRGRRAVPLGRVRGERRLEGRRGLLLERRGHEPQHDRRDAARQHAASVARTDAGTRDVRHHPRPVLPGGQPRGLLRPLGHMRRCDVGALSRRVSLFYDGLANQATPVRDADFDQPELDEQDPSKWATSLTVDYDDWANCPGLTDDDDCSEADGTRYDGTRPELRLLRRGRRARTASCSRRTSTAATTSRGGRVELPDPVGSAATATIDVHRRRRRASSTCDVDPQDDRRGRRCASHDRRRRLDAGAAGRRLRGVVRPVGQPGPRARHRR